MAAGMEWAETTRERIDRVSGYLNKDMLQMMLYDCVTEDDPRRSGQRVDELESLLASYEPRLWDSSRPVIVAPAQQDLEGELMLGKVYQGDVPIGEFRLPYRFITRHIGIYGQTGHAKTTLFFHLQDQLIDAGVPWLSFDPKNDSRVMLRKDDHMTVIPWRRLQWNPLRPPPGMSIQDWWANFSQIMAFSYSWFTASANYLHQHLDGLYDRFAETGRLPSVADIRASISQTSETSRRKSEYHDSVENRIQTLVSVFSGCFVREGVPIEELLNKPCSIELMGLRPAEANWLVETILSWIYFYRLYNGHRGEKLKHVIFVDECHRIFDRSKEYRETAVEMGTPMIAVFPSQFRDFGTGMVFASQVPSQTMNTVHANTLVKLAGNLSSGLDIESVSDAMGLDDELRDDIHKLKRGQWIVRMSDGWTEPFLVETPDYPKGADVTEAEVAERLEKNLGKYLVKEKPRPIVAIEAPDVLLPQISQDAWLLLIHINEHPFTGCTSRYKALSFSGRRAQAAKNELVVKKLAVEVEVPLGGYRPVKFLALTSLAIDMLKAVGHDVKLWKHTGHMGFKHQLYTVLIAYSLKRQGWTVSIEKKLGNGRRVDVYAANDSKVMVIEVEMGEIDLETKLTALDEVDEIFIVTESPTNNITQSERVKACRVTDYLTRLHSNNSSNIIGNLSINPEELDSGIVPENEPGIKTGDNND
jgi:hypothetical protein